MRTSSVLRLQSTANFSTDEGRSISWLVSGRGSGKSYCPNARCAIAPIIEPIDIPRSAGDIIALRPESIDDIGSSLPSDVGRCDRALARSVNNGRKSCNVRCAHNARVVGCNSVRVLCGSVESVVTSRTCMSAIVANSANANRTWGSGVSSGESPTAPSTANCFAMSQLSGPWLDIALAISAKKGIPAKGFGISGGSGKSSEAIGQGYAQLACSA